MENFVKKSCAIKIWKDNNNSEIRSKEIRDI